MKFSPNKDLAGTDTVPESGPGAGGSARCGCGCGRTISLSTVAGAAGFAGGSTSGGMNGSSSTRSIRTLESRPKAFWIASTALSLTSSTLTSPRTCSAAVRKPAPSFASSSQFLANWASRAARPGSDICDFSVLQGQDGFIDEQV